MMESPESIILRQLKEENAPVRSVDFRECMSKFDMAIAHLNGTIIALDAAMTILMEKSGVDQAEFMAEVKKRAQATVEDAQKKMMAQKPQSGIIVN